MNAPSSSELPADIGRIPPEFTAASGASASARFNLVVVGHVDHGKSSLIGRLLADTGSLAEGKLEQARKACDSEGVSFEYAFLLDALLEEQHQNVTIDTTRIPFRTAARDYAIIDAPGHVEFLRNMVTGAAAAEAALLVVDASQGAMEQSRRHALLLSLLGVGQVALLINKMDLVGYSQERFNELSASCTAFLDSLGLRMTAALPISARQGDNITRPSENMPWWQGPSLLGVLDAFSSTANDERAPLRFSVQDIYRQENRRLLVGRVESGILRMGDSLLFSPGGAQSRVTAVERWPDSGAPEARAGEAVGITLADPIFVERGHVGAHASEASLEGHQFQARIFWMHERPLHPGMQLRLRLGHQESTVEVSAIQRVIDGASLETKNFGGAAPCVDRNEVAELQLRSKRLLAFDAQDGPVATSRFALYLEAHPCGGGRVLPGAYYRRGQKSGVVENLFWSSSQVTREMREQRNGHKGLVVWLTGLSGSGKSTIALELERRLFLTGHQVYLLDGDNIRHGLSAGLGFSAADRSENIRRVGEAARLFADAGFIVITAFISPLASDRARARAMIPEGRFLEVYVNAPLSVCRTRDPKGLYLRAERGEIPEFTGVSAPYEPPQRPEMELRTNQLSADQAVEELNSLIYTTLHPPV
jgi:bifunctional enzyme CysN/CysC